MIDVSELLTDPDFAQPVRLVRIIQMVGEDGLAVTSEHVQMIIGVIQPASGDTIAKLPEAQRVEGVLSFWTTFQLTALGAMDSASYQIEYKGSRYIMVSLIDWGTPGNGYVEAALARRELVD